MSAVRRVSVFGLVAALPAAGCAVFLSHIAYTLDNEALAAVFTLAGVAIVYGGSKIR